MTAVQNGKAEVRHNLSQTVHHGYTYDDIMNTVQYIKRYVPYVPEILIVFGSGLGATADILQNPIHLSYEDIPNFTLPTVEGHVGRLVFGTLSNVNTVCMQGRFHYYEGHTLEECTLPIRVLALLGVKTLCVTNTGGAVNPNYKTGDIMFIKDHINFLGFGGTNPLRGPNDSRFGIRFISMNRAYDRTLISKAKDVLDDMGLGPHVHEGVYAMIGGPNYETIAEIKCLRTLGADAVGMSTIPEVLVGRHCGMEVFGFSLITNICVSSYEDNREPNHEEVLNAFGKRQEQLKQFFTKLVGIIGKKIVE